jgi:hypothetical protein
MDEHLLQLRLPGLEIIAPDRHAAIGQAAQSHGLLVMEIEGRDNPRRYSPAVFRRVKDLVLYAYAQEILREREKIDQGFHSSGPRILLITRLPPNEFYASAASEIKTSGAERRSIPNVDEIGECLQRHHYNTMVDSMEGRSLFYQVALFSSVDVIVCQHGAALANLIWARPGTDIIEVLPRDYDWSSFERLANCLSLRYQRISQASLHAPVEPAGVIELLDRLRDGASPLAAARDAV